MRSSSHLDLSSAEPMVRSKSHSPSLLSHDVCNGLNLPKRRKSLSQSIRARLSRQSTREEPPVPPIPKSYSTSSLSAPTSPSSPAPLLSAADLEAAWSTIIPPPFLTPLQYTACYCEENVYLLLTYLSSRLAAVSRAAENIAKRSRTRPVSPAAVFVPVWDLHCLFISNKDRTVLLYQQSASKLPNANYPVIWDYHVVAVATCHLIPLRELSLIPDGIRAAPEVNSKSWVYDSDSRLTTQPYPVEWEQYMEHTFHPEASIPEHFQPVFRVVGAEDYVDWFASDRSHMVRFGEDGREVWNAQPPTWECLVGREARERGVRNNLMQSYVEMVAGGDEVKGRFGEVYDARSMLGMKCMPTDSGALGATIARNDVRVASQGALRANSGDVAVSANASTPSLLLPPRPSTARRNSDMADTASPSVPTLLPLRPSTARRNSDLSPSGAKKGGRIASPLFPAYLHASQQHRSRLPPPPPTPTAPSHTMP